MNLGAVVQKMGSSMNSISMVAVPMFIFAGTFMSHLNLTASIFKATPHNELLMGKFNAMP